MYMKNEGKQRTRDILFQDVKLLQHRAEELL